MPLPLTKLPRVIYMNFCTDICSLIILSGRRNLKREEQEFIPLEAVVFGVGYASS